MYTRTVKLYNVYTYMYMATQFTVFVTTVSDYLAVYTLLTAIVIIIIITDYIQ